MPVFISHSQQDQGPYTSLCVALDSGKVARWDPSQMALGQSLAQQIRAAIDSAEVCVFLATANSIASPWCLAELGAFWGARKTVIVYKSDASLDEASIPKQLQGNVWTSDASQLISEVKHEIQRVQAATPLSGGMVYILRELAGRGCSLGALSPMWVRFNETQAEPDAAYKATKYACQCLEALGLAERFGGDEYGITSHGRRLLESDSLEHKFKRALLYTGSEWAWKKNA